MKILAMANLVVQVILMATVIVAAYFAKRKAWFGVHCTIMRWAVLVQLLAIGAVMLPSMLGYIKIDPASFFNINVYLHHGLGLAVIVLWIYINLVMLGFARLWGRRVIYMRVAFILWSITFVYGAAIYGAIWV